MKLDNRKYTTVTEIKDLKDLNDCIRTVNGVPIYKIIVIDPDSNGVQIIWKSYADSVDQGLGIMKYGLKSFGQSVANVGRSLTGTEQKHTVLSPLEEFKQALRTIYGKDTEIKHTSTDKSIYGIQDLKPKEDVILTIDNVTKGNEKYKLPFKSNYEELNKYYANTFKPNVIKFYNDLILTDKTSFVSPASMMNSTLVL